MGEVDNGKHSGTHTFVVKRLHVSRSEFQPPLLNHHPYHAVLSLIFSFIFNENTHNTTVLFLSFFLICRLNNHDI